jgi:hypothetical protein
VWQDPALSLMQRVMATIHLCQYLPHPLMVMLLLLTPPLILLKGFHDLPMGPLGAAGLGPILIYVCSQQALYNDWPRRLLILPMLIALGTGIAWSNTRAVLGGLFGTTGEFKRTPKRGDASAGKVKGYTLLFDNAALVELALAAYAFWGVWLAATQYQALIAYMSMYAVAFASVAVLTMRDSMAEA